MAPPASNSAQRFNHIGFTVDRTLLEDSQRQPIVDFYGEVFGWEERKEYTKAGELLVLMAGAVDQFMVLFGHDQPVRANPPTDHFGMSVASVSELQRLRGKADDFRRRDPRVELSDYEVSEQRDVVPHNLHKFYVRYLTPFTLEVQHYEYFEQGPS